MKFVVPIILFFFSFIFYIYCAPITVQTGDTGELAMNAYLFQRSHPPGYPIFHFLQYAVTNVLPWGSIFFRASLVSIFFSATILTVLFIYLKPLPVILRVLCPLVICVSSVYWKYTVLPDVFMLHCFFILCLSIVFFRKEKTIHGTILLISIFSLAIAHHQSAVFLLPLVVYELWISRKKKLTYIGVISGVLIFLLCSLSVLLLKTNLVSSWGLIETAYDFWHYLLRMDYGTWNLVAHSSENKNYFLILADFLKNFLWNFWGYLFLVAIVFKSRQMHKPDWKIPQASSEEIVYGFTILLYCIVFFFLLNIDLERHHKAVVERFYLQPALMVIFLFFVLINKINVWSKINIILCSLLLVGCILWDIAFNYKENIFSKNTIIEDYSYNLLIQIDKPEKSILLVETDTEYASILYLQNVEKIKPEVLVIVPQLLAYPWYIERLKKKNSQFRFDKNTNGFSLYSDLVNKNIHNFDFYFLPNYSWIQKYQVTYLPLGKKIQPGVGTNFSEFDAKKLKIRSTYIPSSRSYSISGDLFSRYAHFYLHQGNALYRAQKHNEALISFQQALSFVPYCVPAFRNICLLGAYEKKYCENELKYREEQYYPYF